jgi:hypothetical protein
MPVPTGFMPTPFRLDVKSQSLVISKYYNQSPRL